MKLCQKCGQIIAEEMALCPICGQTVIQGRKFIDNYRIVHILHEGYASILCKAVQIGTEKPVMIRIFTSASGVDDRIANRLKQELKELRKLPSEHFVEHYEIKRSADGTWYRVSEWVAALNWSDLVTGSLLKDPATVFKLFADIAKRLDSLHRRGHFIPHIILDDIMVSEDPAGMLGVKIDYKLSRFLDPGKVRPGPMLKHLTENHPDIVNGRPLDYRSDIWSLGKIFMEILTADFQAKDYLTQIERLPMPGRIRKLIKTMLADDPDLRPRVMDDVVRILGGVKKEELKKVRMRRFLFPQTLARDLLLLRKRQRLLAAILVGVILTIGITVYHYQKRMQHDETVLFQYAQEYSAAVAFVLVEYWLALDETVIYKNRTEGTAFLADVQGYLLTNRHVACPWIEDTHFHTIIETLAQNAGVPEFGYGIYLWFEGERAFFKPPVVSGSTDLADIYVLESAYRSDGSPKLTIAGVANPIRDPRMRGTASIADDFAVLKIDPSRVTAKPIPLGDEMEAEQVPRLSPVITLGFPLGRRTQGRVVNVSATRGYIRRSFEDLLQVDSSMHMGSSGGPVIDMQGQVIGIASSVASERIPGPLPVVTPLADIGMVLPISKVIPFLNDLRKGRVKWNGVFDFALLGKLKKIEELAVAGKWETAREMALAEIERNPGPALYMAAGMLSYGLGDLQAARDIFSQALSMDAGNHHARLMLFLIDWHAGYGPVSAQRRTLLKLDWRSPQEFIGYVARVLDGQVDRERALSSGESQTESGWLNYFVGIDRISAGDLAGGQQLIEQAVLTADTDSWIYFLARKMIAKIRHLRLAAMTNNNDRNCYLSENRKFDRIMAADYKESLKKRARQEAAYAKLMDESVTVVEKRRLLETLIVDDPDNGDLLTGLAFHYAMAREWDRALNVADRFLNDARRESASRLSVGLLVAQILYYTGQKEAARRALQKFHQEIHDAWYRSIAECLLGQYQAEKLIEKAHANPADLITAHVALGFKAEADKDIPRAMKHYKEAMTTYLNDWVEYDLARSNLSRLKAVKDANS